MFCVSRFAMPTISVIQPRQPRTKPTHSTVIILFVILKKYVLVSVMGNVGSLHIQLQTKQGPTSFELAQTLIRP